MIPILEAGVKTSWMAGALEVDFSSPLGDEDISELYGVNIYQESDGQEVNAFMYLAENSQVIGKKVYLWIYGGNASTTQTAYIIHVKIKSNSSPQKQFDAFIRLRVVDPWAPV